MLTKFIMFVVYFKYQLEKVIMKLAAKIDYACRAMIELAVHYHATVPVQLNSVSDAQKIPKKFLVHIFARLKEAGLVDSSRGMGGGYYLTQRPSAITLADVFRAVDRDFLEPVSAPRKTTASERLMASIWREANRAMAEQLEMNLEALVSQIQGFQLDYQI